MMTQESDLPAKSPRKESGQGMSSGTKIILGVIIFIIVIIAAAVLTLNIAISDPLPATDYPFLTHYHVTLPDGEPVVIGTSRILVMSLENEMFCDVDGNREKLVVGQERVIRPRHARISILGFPLIDANFQITLKYLGTTGKNADFDMTVKTSKQVPEFILRRLIPSNMNAQPA